MASSPKLVRSTSKIKHSDGWHPTPFKHRLRRLNELGPMDSELFGIKGTNICEMVRMKLPVPPGFIISSETCRENHKHPDNKEKLTEQLTSQLQKAIPELESASGKVFNLGTTPNPNQKCPLLLSIRHSPSISMPDSMDSVLNLGINDKVVEVMAEVSNNPRWAYDTYRRFIQNYGVVVLGVERQRYEDIMTKVKVEKGVENDSCLDVEALKSIIIEFKTLGAIPRDPWQQLLRAVNAHVLFHTQHALDNHVSGSYSNHSTERNHNTAIIVQAMTHGNIWSDHSGVGVVLSRNPVTGANECCGDYLPFGQGPDLMNCTKEVHTLRNLQQRENVLFDELVAHARALEAHFKRVQNISFVIENGVLFLTSIRTACLSARAAVHIAVSMVVEKRITEREALLRIDTNQLRSFLHQVADSKSSCSIMGKGRAVSPGLISGRMALTAAEVQEWRARGENAILCASSPSCVDISLLKAASGILTAFGGITSDAADLLRTLGIPAVVGARDLQLDSNSRVLTSSDGSHVVCSGNVITIDGTNGTVYNGAVPSVNSDPDQYLTTLLSWADRVNTMHVRGMAHNLSDVRRAKQLGAEGVGCFTTDHMFRSIECAKLVSQLIGADHHETRRQEILIQLEHICKEEFVSLFQLMENRVVKIRLMSEEVHALPCHDDEVDDEKMDEGDKEESKSIDGSSTMDNAHQGMTTPTYLHRDILLSMQVRAIATAVIEARKQGVVVKPSVIAPRISSQRDMTASVELITAAGRSVCDSAEYSIKYLNLKIGAMIDSPVACLRAEQIVETEGCAHRQDRRGSGEVL